MSEAEAESHKKGVHGSRTLLHQCRRTPTQVYLPAACAPANARRRRTVAGAQGRLARVDNESSCVWGVSEGWGGDRAAERVRSAREDGMRCYSLAVFMYDNCGGSERVSNGVRMRSFESSPQEGGTVFCSFFLSRCGSVRNRRGGSDVLACSDLSACCGVVGAGGLVSTYF